MCILAASGLSTDIRRRVGTDNSVWKKEEGEAAVCWYILVVSPVGKGPGPPLWLDAGSAGSVFTTTAGSSEDTET